jgi:hypothetical protein
LSDETPSGTRNHRGAERRLGLVAVDGEDDPLEPGARVEVATDLLNLDACGLVEREASDTGAEGHEGQALRAELVCLDEGVRRRLPDDLRGSGAAELHRRRVDHPARGHLPGRGLYGFAEPDRCALVALGLNGMAAGARDRSSNPAAVSQLGVGRVGDRVNLELCDVRLLDLDLGHVRGGG